MSDVTLDAKGWVGGKRHASCENDPCSCIFPKIPFSVFYCRALQKVPKTHRFNTRDGGMVMCDFLLGEKDSGTSVFGLCITMSMRK